MSFFDRAAIRLRAPRLTRTRIVLALAVALLADGLQILLGPFGWAFADELIDLAAMAMESALLGFHVLYLPTFVVEFIPVADMLPTWTGCVAVVAAMRKRQQDREWVDPPVLEPVPPKRLN